MRVICLAEILDEFCDSEHQAPLVSKAMRTNKWVDVMVAYFVVLFAADFSAAAQAETDVDGMYDAA